MNIKNISAGTLQTNRKLQTSQAQPQGKAAQTASLIVKDSFVPRWDDGGKDLRVGLDALTGAASGLGGFGAGVLTGAGTYGLVVGGITAGIAGSFGASFPDKVAIFGVETAKGAIRSSVPALISSAVTSFIPNKLASFVVGGAIGAGIGATFNQFAK